MDYTKQSPVMKYASVCAGIEAATVALEPEGWEAAWYSEINPFCSRLLKHHYPDTPNLGDMTKLSENKIYADTDFNVLIGGTPCQSFSIAGLRGGLDTINGNLALEYCRILIAKRPQWFLWENVPGVFSSFTDEQESKIYTGNTRETTPDYDGDPEYNCTQTADFATLLSAFRECGYSCAWRVLDSEYFGVPQRRRRVFVVGYLGDDWRPAFSVLFEQESLQRDFTPSRKAKEKAAGTFIKSSTKSNRWPAEVASTLDTTLGNKMGLDNQHIDAGASWFVPFYPIQIAEKYIDQMLTIDQNININYGITNALMSQGNGQVGNGAICFNGQSSEYQSMNPGEVSPALDKSKVPSVLYSIMPQNSGTDYKARECDVTQPVVRSGNHNGNQGGDYVAQGITLHGSDGTSSTASFTDTASTLRTRAPGTIENSTTTIAMHDMIVRRLTPLECERLQGFPDNYTNIPGACDSNRYSALGNSMTTHVIQWIGKRIKMVNDIIHNTTEQV